MVVALQEQIERLKDTSVPEVERLNLVDSCLSGISHLTNEVKDASSYLPAYDQRTYSTVRLAHLPPAMIALIKPSAI